MRTIPNANTEVSMEETSAVKVYNFWTYDKGAESPMLAPYKATREAITRQWKGKVADGTEQIVSLSDLDAHGRYRRIATGWGELQ
jgi:hypothetical protein